MGVLEDLLESAGSALVSAIKTMEKMRTVDILTNSRASTTVFKLQAFIAQVTLALDAIDTLEIDIDTTIDDGLDVFEADVLKFVRDEIIRIVGNQEYERFNAERFKSVVIDRIMLDDQVSRVIKHFEWEDDGAFSNRYSLDKSRLHTVGEVFFLDRGKSSRFIKLIVRSADDIDTAEEITYTAEHYRAVGRLHTTNTYTIPIPYYPNP